MTRNTIFATLASAAVGSGAMAAGVNLLANPGFESGGGSLQDWIPFNNASANIELAQEGAASCKMFGPFGDPFGGSGVVQFQEGVVTPGNAYSLTGFAQTPFFDTVVGSQNFMVFKIEFFNAAFELIAAHESRPIEGPKPGLLEDIWYQSTVSAVAPADAVSIQAVAVFVQPNFEGGAIWVDGFSLNDLGPAPASFQNGSWEDGTSYWTTFNNAFLNVAQQDDGCYSLLTFPPGAGDSGATQVFGATAGQQYDVTAKALSPSNDTILGTENQAVLVIDFRDASNTVIGSATEIIIVGTNPKMPQDTWVTGSVSAVAPAGTDSALVGVIYSSPLGETGAIYFDSIGVTASEACAGDSDGNGLVDFDDLLAVLGNWGACTGCSADFDGNNIVDFDDLLTVLGNWGPCS